MKKTIFLLTALAGLFAFQTQAALAPETISLNYSRTHASQYVNTNAYLAGSTISFSNSMVCTSGWISYGQSNVVVGSVTNLVWYTNDTRVAQDLTGLWATLKIGNSVTNLDYACSTLVAVSGTFFVTAILPTATQLKLSPTILGNLRIQCTLSNAAGLTYTYPGDQYLYIRTPLQY